MSAKADRKGRRENRDRSARNVRRRRVEQCRRVCVLHVSADKQMGNLMVFMQALGRLKGGAWERPFSESISLDDCTYSPRCLEISR